MNCCVPADVQLAHSRIHRPAPESEEIRLASRDLANGARQTDLAVPGVRCAACIAAVEKGLSKLPGVEAARVNLSTKRVAVSWRTPDGTPPDLIGTLRRIGYDAHLFAAEADSEDSELGRLVRALAVAGFCAMNIMLLSVSVWFGADADTREAFHFISAALAVPALLYSGRIFYISAWSALRHGRTNMDVPISIGVTLAFALSLHDTLRHAPHAYFDAATSLLFFLLIGRTLDQMMRERARSAVAGLAKLAPAGATIVRDGRAFYVPIAEVEPGTDVLVAAGERIPVDGVVVQGASDLDCSLVTGESVPRTVAAGDAVQAGVMNLTGPVTLRATAHAEDSLISEMLRMMEAAEGGRARYRRMADRAASLYSPVVHAMAAIAFAAWLIATGDWHVAATIAIAVLIITCPCALGLAVPIVQVVAARRLFERGIMVKDGSALERLAEIDGVAFDKTGTLTLGRPSLIDGNRIPADAMRLARGLAVGSRHPVATAIAAFAGPDTECIPVFERIEEIPGLGIEATQNGDYYRLGRPDWATARPIDSPLPDGASVSVLGKNGEPLAVFMLEDRSRPNAQATIDALSRLGVSMEIISGDRGPAVRGLASKLGIRDFSAGLLPAEKVNRVASHRASGRRILMVGDGLNDAPALAAAHVSMAPATAAEIGRNAADFVFLHESLSAVIDALLISRRSRRLVFQNFALAAGYNALAVPVAVMGYVTPLLAAVAMSLSSILVVANAMRVSSGRSAS
jgi:Cu2+-exporting ATPase